MGWPPALGACLLRRAEGRGFPRPQAAGSRRPQTESSCNDGLAECRSQVESGVVRGPSRRHHLVLGVAVDPLGPLEAVSGAPRFAGGLQSALTWVECPGGAGPGQSWVEVQDVLDPNLLTA